MTLKAIAGVVSLVNAPLAGVVNVTTGNVVSTVNVCVADEPMLPAASVWRTCSVWLPVVSAARLEPEVQAVQAPLSTLHSEVPVLASVTLKAIAGVVSFVNEPLAGVVSETDGDVVSTVKVWVDDEPMLPAASVWRTCRVWLPSVSVARLEPEVQAVQAPLSTLHCDVPRFVSVTLKAMAGVLSLVYEEFTGAVSETTGLVVSIVTLTALESALVLEPMTALAV